MVHQLSGMILVSLGIAGNDFQSQLARLIFLWLRVGILCINLCVTVNHY